MQRSPIGKTAATDQKKGSLFNIKVESLANGKKSGRNQGIISGFKKN
jgi:hypothetical protein